LVSWEGKEARRLSSGLVGQACDGSHPDLSDFMCVIKIIQLIILESKIYSFHSSQKEGWIDQASILTTSN
jgi:hypothetical protein